MAEIERRRERGNYLVREKFLREKGDFFSFFLYEMFSRPKSIIHNEKLSLTKILSNKKFFKRYIDVCKKSFKNDIPLCNNSND